MTRSFAESHWTCVGLRGVRAVAVAVCLAAAPAAGVAQSDPRASFLDAIEAAQESRKAALREAGEEYRRTADALEGAGARLGADARRRLEQGALSDARRNRDAAVAGAEADWLQRVEGAVRDYEPAGEMWDAVKATVATLRTELGIYRAVLEAADFAVNEATTAVTKLSRTAAGSVHDLAALEVRAASAETEFKAAERAFEQTVRRRPQEVEAEGFGAERFTAFAQGLGARFAGDETAAEAADRAGDEAFQARLDAIAEADAANETAEAHYDAAVAAARAKRDAASAVWRDAAAAVRRAHQGTAATVAERDEASRHREASLAARRVAFVDTVRSVRVYQAAELQALQHALTAAALSAIAESEEASLAKVPAEAVRRILNESLDSYGESRRSALAALEATLQDRYQAAVKETRAARIALDAGEAENRELLAEVKAGLDRVAADIYSRAVEAADGAFENVLVQALGQGQSARWNSVGPTARAVEMSNAAAREHDLAMQAARASREAAVRAAFPTLINDRNPLAGLPIVKMVDFDPGSWIDSADRVLREFGRYKAARSSADEEFRRAILAAAIHDTTALEARVRDNRAAVEAALHARGTMRGAGEHLVAFDEQAAEQARVLEAEVRDRLLLAARSGEPQR